ncbi:GlxA family transcriptional regulator [Nocardia sp. IFM 10818]
MAKGISPEEPLHISILALPDSAPMAVYGLHELFASVGTMWQELTGDANTVRRIEPRIVSRTGTPFDTYVGTPICPHNAITDEFSCDVVIVTDVALPMDPAAPGHWQDEIAWVRARLDAGALVCSTCTGSIVLAEAGLLDGRDAASHWSAAALFRDRYDTVRFHPDRILCDSGHEGRLLTTGGASAWHDLALYLIGRFCGPSAAVHTAKIFLIGDREDGQLPYAAMTRPRQHQDAVIEQCQIWIADNYAEPSPVTRMVEKSGLTERTFKRRFRIATGYTPVDYVQALRVEHAKQLLETTGKSVDAIASAVGYHDPAFFRRLFKRLTGIAPTRYRQRYQGIRRSADFGHGR